MFNIALKKSCLIDIVIDKMNKILDDQSQFKRLGPISSNDNTASIELCLQKQLLNLVKVNLMPNWIHDVI